MFTISLLEKFAGVQREDGEIVIVSSEHGYASEYDPEDPLHAFLDKLDSDVVRTLAAGGNVAVWKDTCATTYAACEALFAPPPGPTLFETFILGILR